MIENINIYGYTEPSVAPYPAYVSINQVSLDTVSITVRASGSDTSAEIVLPIKEMGILSACLDSYSPFAEEDGFLFELGDEVKLALSDERGTVVGRAEYSTHTSYLVHYKAANGCATTAWFDEGYLLLDCADDCATCEALPTDAEIPLEQPAEAVQ